jgi:TIR domain
MARPNSGDAEAPTQGASLSIFVCYRREDTAGFARALKTVLGDRYGRDRVFMDLDNIAPGELWEDVVNRAVGSCDVLIALIGREWMTLTDRTGRLRIENPIDPVRLEIETALRERLKVIPALIQEAKMPDTDALPSGLAALPGIQALAITDDWDAGVAKLTSALDRIAEAKAAREAADSVVVVPEAEDRPAAGGGPGGGSAPKGGSARGPGQGLSKTALRSIVVGAVVLALIGGGIAIAKLAGNHEPVPPSPSPSLSPSPSPTQGTNVAALRVYLQSAYRLVEESAQQRDAINVAFNNHDAAGARSVAAGRRRLLAVAKGLSVPPGAEQMQDALERSLQGSAIADDMFVRVIQGTESLSTVKAYQNATVIPAKKAFIALYNKLRKNVSGAPPPLPANPNF